MDYGAFVPGGSVRVGPTGSGALAGLDFAAKDLIDVAGFETGGGNPDWRASHTPPSTSAPVISKLLRAGATLVGKTITDELAFSLEGANAHYGTPVNPSAPDRLPGGSSSGSAVAVASGGCDFAIGTDTGGSVRIPASFCGIYGIRPTHGRVSTEGVIAFGPSFDTVGWFARSPETLQRVGRVLLRGGTAQSVRQLLVASDVLGYVDSEIADATRRGIADWPIDGEIALMDDEPDAIFRAFRTIQGSEIWASLGDWITETSPQFGGEIAKRFASTQTITADAVDEQKPYRAALRSRMATLLPTGVVVAFPTAPTLPPRKGTPTAEIDAFYVRSLTINAIAGLAGLPQISMPLADVDDVPVGISILAGPGEDETLLALASTLAEGHRE